MEPALTLANTPLDLQITICIFLYPADILALRLTCKALESVTRQRTVWMAVLYRVCLDNTLFLPSFPIPDMSVMELERAAMAPHRWIELCGAFQKQNFDDFSSDMLRPRTTRIIKEIINSLYIVPGGRYMVTAGDGLHLWDLGYVSTVDCKRVASVGHGGDFEWCIVQATSDGKGLIILTTYCTDRLSIFEIYPQSEIPVLTQIAHLDWISSAESPAHLLPDTLILRVKYDDRIVFRIVDYRTNYSTSFSADIDVNDRSNPFRTFETFATKTAIIVFYKEDILIWAIPPLSPQPSDLTDRFLHNDFTHIPPLFKIPFPDGTLRRPHKILEWMILSSWFFESWESIYFGILFSDSNLLKFKLVIKPDLTDASLHFINMSEIISDGLIKSLSAYKYCDGFRICEDALVYFWNNYKKWGAYTGSLTSESAPFTNFVTRWDGYAESLCPTSGRYAYCTDDGDGTFISRLIIVVDLF